jgi:hypothetical protein
LYNITIHPSPPPPRRGSDFVLRLKFKSPLFTKAETTNQRNKKTTKH